MKYLNLAASIILSSTLLASNAYAQKKFIQTPNAEAAQRYTLEMTKMKLLSCDTALMKQKEYLKKLNDVYTSCAESSVEMGNKFIAANKYYQGKVDSLTRVNFLLYEDIDKKEREIRTKDAALSNYRAAAISVGAAFVFSLVISVLYSGASH